MSTCPVNASSFLGEIKLLPISFAPKGWISCRGQSMIIGDHTALYSVIGNRFGGNGINSFNIPSLSKPTEGLEYFMCIDPAACIPSR